MTMADIKFHRPEQKYDDGLLWGSYIVNGEHITLGDLLSVLSVNELSAFKRRVEAEIQKRLEG